MLSLIISHAEIWVFHVWRPFIANRWVLDKYICLRPQCFHVACLRFHLCFTMTKVLLTAFLFSPNVTKKWLVVPASEWFQLQTMHFYLKPSGDSRADSSAEISKPPATPLLISCEMCWFFNDDVNHLSGADYADGNWNLITGTCCAIRDGEISKTCACHCWCKKTRFSVHSSI